MRKDCGVLTQGDVFYKSNEQRIYQLYNNRSNLRKKNSHAHKTNKASEFEDVSIKQTYEVLK
jgi:hypothetical protein